MSRGRAGSVAPAIASTATAAPGRAGSAGSYVHIAVDDATRIAYVEVLEDEKASLRPASSVALSPSSPASASGSSG